MFVKFDIHEALQTDETRVLKTSVKCHKLEVHLLNFVTFLVNDCKVS